MKYPELADEITADASCDRRLDAGTRAWFDAHAGNINTPEARADMVDDKELPQRKRCHNSWNAFRAEDRISKKKTTGCNEL